MDRSNEIELQNRETAVQNWNTFVVVPISRLLLNKTNPSLNKPLFRI